MPCHITARSAIKKIMRQLTTTNKAKNQNLNSKAPSNNVKLQSHKTLTTEIYFFLTTQQMEFFLNKTR